MHIEVWKILVFVFAYNELSGILPCLTGCGFWVWWTSMVEMNVEAMEVSCFCCDQRLNICIFKFEVYRDCLKLVRWPYPSMTDDDMSVCGFEEV